MSTEGEERRAICILSFDSGGPGTYSQLLILKEYMSRLASDLGVTEENVYPADYFDLMGGVGFGGLVAIMLGHLRMNVDGAVGALVTVATAVFSEGSQDVIDPEINSRKLKEAIEDMLQMRKTPTSTKMYERSGPQTGCKVVLYAATSSNIRHPQAFRTYSFRGASLNPTIVEAVCATMAIPSYFLPVKIGQSQQNFVGGALGANNPTCELLKEAGAVFGNERRVARIINIGCGVPPALSLEAMANETVAARLLKEMPDECEAAAKELAARLYDVDAYLRLSVEKGIGDIDMDQWGMLGDIEMHTACYIEAQPITQVLDASLKSLQVRGGTVTLGHLNQSSSIKIAAKKAPSVTPYFVIRNKLWEILVWHLVTSPSSRQRILPITGMGGSGKTQLVSYFLQEYPSLFKHVVYVDASTLSSIKADLQTWVRALGDGSERDAWEDAVRILACTPSDERWGLILDNADDPTLNLDPVLPKNVNLTVIITSRNRNIGNLSTTYHMELGEMEPEEALATLLHATRLQLPLSTEERKSANTLLKELGCLAVALVQAGTYCHELSHSLTQYLTLFYSHRAELMKKAEPSSLDNYQRGAYTTLDLSYNALPHASRKFLHFISFFHHTDIPLSALATVAKRNFEEPPCYLPRTEDHASVITELKELLCVGGTWGEMQVQEILRTLQSFSLLSISSIDDSVLLRLHPLIQAWSRDMDHSASHHRAMALQVLTACSGDDVFRLRPQLLPHVLDMQHQLKGRDMHVNDSMAAGKVLKDQGHYRAAEELFEAALKIMGTSAENNEELISTISEWLASVYRDEGRWNDAEMLGVNVLEQRRRILGIEHLDTISAAANLATTLHDQGRYSDAEKLAVEVLERRRSILGMEHPDTIGAAGNLAATYTAQGKWGEAEKLEVEVLEQSRRIIGIEHPDTITALANLAVIYRVQGRWGEAEKLGLEVLQQRKKVLGAEHPDTIRAAANLAVTYASQGRWSEAEKLQVNVLDQRKRIMGMTHPKTITAAANLASTYHSQGRWSDAEKLELEVLQQQRSILGVEHPDTIRAEANLAMTYNAQGRWSEAEELGLEVLDQRKRVLGMEHPDTIRAAANLAAIYNAQGRWSEAEKLKVDVLEQRRNILGMEHPDTIRAAANLAATYNAQGRWSEAEKLEVEVLEQCRRILVMEHPSTIRAASNLASTYHSQGQWSEAEKLQAEVLEQLKKVLGMQHPDTLVAAGNLAATYNAQGRWSEAEKLQVEVLEQQRKIIGVQHPDTIMAAAHLAATYGKQNRWEESAALLAPAVQLGLEVLGQPHPRTQLYLGHLVLAYSQLGKEKEAQEMRELLASRIVESREVAGRSKGVFKRIRSLFRFSMRKKVKRVSGLRYSELM